MRTPLAMFLLVSSLAACVGDEPSEELGDEEEVTPPTWTAEARVSDLPAPGTIGTPIDGYAVYDPTIDNTSACAPGSFMLAGTRAFSQHLASLGMAGNNYTSCQDGFHPRGMALDVYAGGFAGLQQFANWLTANGNEMARRLGLVQIVFNSRMWRSYNGGSGKPQGAWGSYGGSDPHTSHVHISFGAAGAAGQTSYFRDVLGGAAPDGGPVIAMIANTNNVWVAGGAVPADLHLGAMPGTSPAIVQLSGGGYQIAFQANTGHLWTTGTLGTADLGLGMMPGTSPDIAAAGGGYQIAFQANTGNLWTTGVYGTADLNLGMMPGTSPSIITAGGGYQIAFQANTGNLWTTGVYGTADLHLGMMPGTSPSIITAGGGYQIAFQANTGNLWTTGVYGTADLHLGMRGGTSPSITAAGGRYQIAFQANTTSLWTTGVYGTADLGLGMMSGTSPSITAAGGSYQIAFQANTGNLWTTGALGTADQHLGMRAGTSPAIARLANGSVEVVFQANTSHLWRLAGGAADLGLGMGAGSPAL